MKNALNCQKTPHLHCLFELLRALELCEGAVEEGAPGEAAAEGHEHLHKKYINMGIPLKQFRKKKPVEYFTWLACLATAAAASTFSSGRELRSSHGSRPAEFLGMPTPVGIIFDLVWLHCRFMRESASKSTVHCTSWVIFTGNELQLQQNWG